MKCADLIEQLPLLLYDELEGEEAASIHQHLESCTSCADQWAELQQTRQLLDEWSPAAAAADVRAVREASPVAKGEPGRARWGGRSIVMGLAAGLLLMVTLFFVGVEVQRTEGRLTLSFGRGPLVEPVPAHLANFDPQSFERRLQLATYEQIDQTNFELVEEIDRFFSRWDESHTQQRDELLKILARALEQDLSRLEQGITTVVQDQQRTKQRLDELTWSVMRGDVMPITYLESN